MKIRGYISKFSGSILIWMVLLQMVNVSVNPARHLNVIGGKFTYSEDLSINKIESVYELVLEYIFKLNVPETQDADEEGLYKAAFTYCLIDDLIINLRIQLRPVIHNHNYMEHIPEYVPALHSPPPQAKA